MATNERRVILTAQEAANYACLSLITLNRIEREGLLFPFHTPEGSPERAGRSRSDTGWTLSPQPQDAGTVRRSKPLFERGRNHREKGGE